MRASRLLFAAAVAMAAASACSGGGNGDQAVPDHACDMLTTEEASEVLGVPAHGPAEDTDRSSGTYCQWASKDSGPYDPDASDESETVPYFISVEDDRGAEAVQSFASTKLTTEEGEGEVVDGVGDDAFFLDHGLYVRHGDRVFSTYVGENGKHPLSNRAARERERRAAELVLARLGDPENEDIVEKAEECAETRRCTATRVSACLLAEADVSRITGYQVEEVDGTARPASSETAAVCTYLLEQKDPELGGVAGRVEVWYEPEARPAAAEYQRRFDQQEEDERLPLPAFGPEAFFDVPFGEVLVLTDDFLIQVGYELEDATDADYPAIDAAMVELTRIVLADL